MQRTNVTEQFLIIETATHHAALVSQCWKMYSVTVNFGFLPYVQLQYLQVITSFQCLHSHLHLKTQEGSLACQISHSYHMGIDETYVQSVHTCSKVLQTFGEPSPFPTALDVYLVV